MISAFTYVFTLLVVPAKGLQLAAHDWSTAVAHVMSAPAGPDAEVSAGDVKEAFRHALKGYVSHAADYDDVRPISGEARDWLGTHNTLLDSLSTMWLMGLHDEFNMAKQHVANISFSFHLYDHSLFETTIRALGGLCSAHSLSGEQVFLKKAVELADYLLPCFTDSICGGFDNLAERGSLQLEFRYVSQQTGDPRYQEAVDHIFTDMLANGIHVQNMGAGHDSFYEYLLKVYLQTGMREEALRDAWVDSMNQMRDVLIKTTPKGTVFLSDGGKNEMEHLACFAGGMLALGAHSLPDNELAPQWTQLGENLTKTCYKTSRMTKTGLAPERTQFYDEDPEMRLFSSMTGQSVSILRPEIAESIFYQHYYTGDPKYKTWAANMFRAFNTSSRTEIGFAEVMDVDEDPPRLRDKMESFFLAETLKYLYLTLAPPGVLDLSKFVFNTEAHPLKVNASGKIAFNKVAKEDTVIGPFLSLLASSKHHLEVPLYSFFGNRTIL